MILQLTEGDESAHALARRRLPSSDYGDPRIGDEGAVNDEGESDRRSVYYEI